MVIEVCPSRKAEFTLDPMIDGQVEKEYSCLRELKLMVKGDDSLEKLSSTVLNDQFLLHFVRGRKCDPKRAFSTLQNYISLRRERYKEMFGEVLPSKLPLRKKLVKIFKNFDENNAISGLFRISEWNPDEVSFDELFLTGLLHLESGWDTENIERNGINFLLDTKGFSLKHARECTPHQVQKLITLFWNAFPMKYHHIHVINAPFYFTMTFNVVKHFLPPKLRSRIHMHGNDLASFHKFYSPDVLPTWLGGNLTDEDAFDLDFYHSVLVKEEYYRNFNEKVLKL